MVFFESKGFYFLKFNIYLKAFFKKLINFKSYKKQYRCAHQEGVKIEFVTCGQVSLLFKICWILCQSVNIAEDDDDPDHWDHKVNQDKKSKQVCFILHTKVKCAFFKSLFGGSPTNIFYKTMKSEPADSWCIFMCVVIFNYYLSPQRRRRLLEWTFCNL